jgi:hypothetical protein
VGPKPSSERRAHVAELAAVAAIVLTLIAAGTALASRPPRATKPAPQSACVDSFDPSCGPLRWEPAPLPNSPTQTSITPAAIRTVAGRAVSLDARATDADAPIACHWVLFGDETAGLVPAISIQRQFGLWRTPSRSAGTFSATFTHTYAKPGTYHVQFGARSGEGCSNDYSPYGGESESTATVTVASS